MRIIDQLRADNPAWRDWTDEQIAESAWTHAQGRFQGDRAAFDAQLQLDPPGGPEPATAPEKPRAEPYQTKQDWIGGGATPLAQFIQDNPDYAKEDPVELSRQVWRTAGQKKFPNLSEDEFINQFMGEGQRPTQEFGGFTPPSVAGAARMGAAAGWDRAVGGIAQTLAHATTGTSARELLEGAKRGAEEGKGIKAGIRDALEGLFSRGEEGPTDDIIGKTIRRISPLTSLEAVRSRITGSDRMAERADVAAEAMFEGKSEADVLKELQSMSREEEGAYFERVAKGRFSDAERLERESGRSLGGGRQWAYDLSGIPTQLIPTVAMAFVTRNPATLAASIGTVAYGNAFQESRKMGLSIPESRRRSIDMAGLEGATSVIPIHMILKPGNTLAKGVLAGMGSESVQESFMNASSILYDAGVFGIETSVADAVKSTGYAAALGGIAGGAFGGAAAGIGRIARGRDPYIQREEQTTDQWATEQLREMGVLPPDAPQIELDQTPPIIDPDAPVTAGPGGVEVGLTPDQIREQQEQERLRQRHRRDIVPSRTEPPPGGIAQTGTMPQPTGGLPAAPTAPGAWQPAAPARPEARPAAPVPQTGLPAFQPTGVMPQPLVAQSLSRIMQAPTVDDAIAEAGIAVDAIISGQRVEQAEAAASAEPNAEAVADFAALTEAELVAPGSIDQGATQESMDAIRRMAMEPNEIVQAEVEKVNTEAGIVMSIEAPATEQALAQAVQDVGLATPLINPEAAKAVGEQASLLRQQGGDVQQALASVAMPVGEDVAPGTYGALVQTAQDNVARLKGIGRTHAATAEARPLTEAEQAQVAALPAITDRTGEAAKLGVTGDVTTPNRKHTAKVDYAIVDLANLVVSHDAVTGESNPDFPHAIQSRERGEQASLDIVRERGKALDPDRLGPSDLSDAGAPVVGQDLVVESGNGRVMSYQWMYDQNTPAAAKVRTWLDEVAKEHGVDISGMARPVMVAIRRGTDNEQRFRFGVESNLSEVETASSLEQAQSDAAKLLADGGPIREGNLSDQEEYFFGNDGWVQTDRMYSPEEVKRLRDEKTGKLGAKFIRAMSDALYLIAYKDTDLLTRYNAAHTKKDQEGAILSALRETAPYFARMRQDGNNELPDAIVAGVRKALTAVDDYKENQSLARDDPNRRAKAVPADYLDTSPDLFGTDRPFEQVELNIATALVSPKFTNPEGKQVRTTSTHLAEVLEWVAQEELKAGRSGDIFGLEDLDVRTHRSMVGKNYPVAPLDLRRGSIEGRMKEGPFLTREELAEKTGDARSILAITEAKPREELEAEVEAFIEQEEMNTRQKVQYRKWKFAEFDAEAAWISAQFAGDNPAAQKKLEEKAVRRAGHAETAKAKYEQFTAIAKKAKAKKAKPDDPTAQLKDMAEESGSAMETIAIKERQDRETERVIEQEGYTGDLESAYRHYRGAVFTSEHGIGSYARRVWSERLPGLKKDFEAELAKAGKEPPAKTRESRGEAFSLGVHDAVPGRRWFGRKDPFRQHFGEGRMTKARVERLVDAMKMPAGIRVEVHKEKGGALPKTLNKDASGWEQGGVVHIVAERIRNPRDLQILLAHEVYGHVGLDILSKTQKAEVMAFFDQWKKNNSKEFQELRELYEKRYGDQNLEGFDQLHEYVALAAERQSVHPSLWKRFRAWLHDALRAMGFKGLQLRDMADVAAQSRRAARTKKDPPAQGRAYKPVRQGGQRRMPAAEGIPRLRPTVFRQSRIPRGLADGLREHLGRADDWIPKLDKAKAKYTRMAAWARREGRRQFLRGGLLISREPGREYNLHEQERDRQAITSMAHMQVNQGVQAYENAIKLDYKGRRLTPEQVELHYKQLRSPEPLPELKGKPHLIKALSDMRKAIDAHSHLYAQELNREIAILRARGLDKRAEQRKKLLDALQKNIGAYTHRFYGIHRDFKDWKRKDEANPALRRAALQHIVQQRMRDGMDQQSAIAYGKRLMADLENSGKESRTTMQHMANRRLGHVDQSAIMQRQDIAEPIRQWMGEIRNPAESYAVTVGHLSNLYGAQKFLNFVVTDGIGKYIWDRDNRPADIANQLDEIAPMADSALTPMAGLYAPKEVALALHDAVTEPGEAFFRMSGPLRWALWAQSFVKYGKTVLSPITAHRNYISGATLTFTNMTMFQRGFGTGLRKAWEGAGIYMGTDQSKATAADPKAHAKLNAYVKRLVELKVVYDSVHGQEIMGYVKDMGADMVGIMERPDATVAAMQTAAQGSRTALKKFNKLMQNYYSYGDDLWKIAGYEVYKRKFMEWTKPAGQETPSQLADRTKKAEVLAANRVRDIFPSYSDLPRAAVALRRFPLVGPFGSFAAVVIRTAAMQIKHIADDIRIPARKVDAIKRLAAMASLYPLLSAAHAISSSAVTAGSAALDALDLDGWDAQEAFDDALSGLAAEFRQFSHRIFMGRDDLNRIISIDLTHLNFYAAFHNVANIWDWQEEAPTLDRIINTMEEVIGPFLAPEMLVKPIFQAAANKNDWGAEIYNEHGDQSKKVGDIAKFIGEAVAPGGVVQATNILKGMFDFHRRSGEPYSAADESAAIFGFRKSRFDPARALRSPAWRYRETADGARTDVRSVIRDLDASDDDIREIFKSSTERVYDAQDMLRLQARRSAIVGSTQQQSRDMMDQAGVSKRVANYALGYAPRRAWEPLSKEGRKQFRESMISRRFTFAEAQRRIMLLSDLTRDEKIAVVSGKRSRSKYEKD